mgnify:FL=1|tara:strand:+ start:3627 stop:4925 length:1299 start_codon:yes stop_codon:yes gene_type:complete
MVLLKLKRINFIKKIASKLYSKIPNNDSVSSKDLFKRFSLHIIFIFALSLVVIPISNLDGLNPITHAFKDLTFSDIYFSRIRKGSLSDTASSKVYIVNIGQKDKETTRKEVSYFLNKINNSPKFKPKSIGVDISFTTYSNNELIDRELSKSLKNENIVTICDLKENGELKYPEKNINIFQTENFGFSKQWIEKDRPFTERYFKAKALVGKQDIDHISLAIIKTYDINIYNEFLKNKKSNEPNLINYRGNYTIENSLSITDTTGLEKLKNKVVLIGLYENDTDGKPIYTEDTHWAPTNENYFGRSEKNIYGIEIQAHIISSIINNDFISSKSTFNNLFQFLISILIYFMMLKFYIRNKTKYVFAKLFMQLFIVIFLIVLSILQIHWFNLYLDYTIITISAFVSAEIISIIEMIINRYYLSIRKFVLTNILRRE